MKKFLTRLAAIAAFAALAPTFAPVALAQVEPDEPNYRQIEQYAQQLRDSAYWARVYAEREAQRDRRDGFRNIAIQDLRQLEREADRFYASARSAHRDAVRLDIELSNVERAVWNAERTVSRREFSYQVVMRLDEARRYVNLIDRELGFGRARDRIGRRIDDRIY